MAEPYETPPRMKEIYGKDKERYSESDELIREGDLKGAADVHPDREELRNRLIASIGLETGVGITADFVTSPLLVSPIPGSRPLYYALNYGIGYGTNWLAQKIRGNENFDQGEAVAAGGFQVIPFGTTARGFKGISRAALKGSTGAVVGEQVRVGIDEQRFLNPEETLSAAVAGGLIGGTFKATPEAIDLSRRLTRKIKGVLPGGDLAYGLGGTGGAEAMKGPGKLNRFVPPSDSEIGKVHQILLNSAVLGPKNRFNWNAYRNALTSPQKRVVASAYSSTPYSKIATSWKAHRKLLMDSFETVYGEAMIKRGISSDQIDIDHLYTLVQSMGIYDDVVYGSKLWNKIQEKILSRGYKPGDAVDNLAAIDPGTHIVKTAFFNKLHGINGTKFFTRNRLKNMDRLELLDMYLDQVDEGTRILNEGMKVFDTLYTNRNLIPEELVERLADIVVGPEGQLPMYTTPELRNIIKQIKKDITERPDIKGPNIRNLLKEFEGYNPDLDVFLKSSPKSLDMLVARIEGATPRQLKKRFKGYNPDQLELAFDTLTPTMVARIKKAYNTDGKGGTPR